jgi:hypothetical protein
VIVLEPVRPNLHHRPILRAASWAAVQPYNSPLAVRNMLVLEMPEEQVSVVFGCDFDVAIAQGKIRASAINKGLEKSSPPSAHERLTQHAF